MLVRLSGVARGCSSTAFVIYQCGRGSYQNARAAYSVLKVFNNVVTLTLFSDLRRLYNYSIKLVMKADILFRCFV